MLGLIRIIGAAIAVVVMLLVPVTAQSAPATYDSAIGDFDRMGGGHIGFEAYSDPDGANPFGHLSSTTGTIQSQYDVVCLAVSGNGASIGLVPTDSPDNAGTPRVLVVVDSGLPGGAGDQYGFIIKKNAPTRCAHYVKPPPFAPLSGDIVVHDEP
jgi:hypothetical protein